MHQPTLGFPKADLSVIQQVAGFRLEDTKGKFCRGIFIPHFEITTGKMELLILCRTQYLEVMFMVLFSTPPPMGF